MPDNTVRGFITYLLLSWFIIVRAIARHVDANAGKTIYGIDLAAIKSTIWGNGGGRVGISGAHKNNDNIHILQDGKPNCVSLGGGYKHCVLSKGAAAGRWRSGEKTRTVEVKAVCRSADASPVRVMSVRLSVCGARPRAGAYALVYLAVRACECQRACARVCGRDSARVGVSKGTTGQVGDALSF